VKGVSDALRLRPALEKNLGEFPALRSREEVLPAQCMAPHLQRHGSRHGRRGGGPAGWNHQRPGHISPQGMKRYSRIHRRELNRAAAALEPKFLKNVLVITPEVADRTTVQSVLRCYTC